MKEWKEQKKTNQNQDKLYKRQGIKKKDKKGGINGKRRNNTDQKVTMKKWKEQKQRDYNIEERETGDGIKETSEDEDNSDRKKIIQGTRVKKREIKKG